jgi:hypothetical protein
MLSRLLRSSSNRIDDDGDASDADSPSQSEDALDAPLLPPENDEDDADAAARREALRSCCERGLVLVRGLAIYLLIVSAGAGVLASIAEWVVVAARRARGTDDDDAREWWGCLCEQSVAAHWVDSSQPEKIPVVLSATLLQSIILASASLLVAHRACVRMDWLGSAVVNVLFLTLAILLPPAASGWPAPTAISSSLSTLAAWAFRPFGDDGCKSSRRFARWCVVVSAAAVTTNAGVLIFLVWAERLRRRAAAAGGKRSKPRAVVALGGLALAGYAVAALARLGVSVLAQRSFDAFFFERWSVVAYVAGQPGFQLAGATAFASVAMAVRGAATGDRAHLRVAALLGAVALYVNLPAFVATADAARRRGLWLGGTNQCVDDYLARRDASDMYGRPSPARAPPLCRYIITEIWGTALHLLFLLLSTIAAAAAVRGDGDGVPSSAVAA